MAAADTCYQTPYGKFELARYPSRRREPLQAWCAADTLLLAEAHRLATPAADILVVNDEHGALCVPLQATALWTDSALAVLSLKGNARRNGRQPPAVTWSTDSPSGAASLVLLRVPKQLAYFEYQLSRLSACLTPGTTVLAAGMDKHLSPRTAQLLETWIGPTLRHRGQRKARLFSATRDGRRIEPPETGWYTQYFCEELQSDLCALPNVFSRDAVDIGSRFLLQQLPRLGTGNGTLADLACGNGILGLTAYHKGLADRILFCDESAMAIESARRNSARLYPDNLHKFSYHHADGLKDYSGPGLDLILCNPPFHLNHTVDELAGRHLLAQCATQLVSAGHLCVVANRHLDYLPSLKRNFGQVEQIAQNAKFKVWLAHKS